MITQVFNMPRSLQVEVEPAVFKWLRTSAGWTVEEVAKRLKTGIEARSVTSMHESGHILLGQTVMDKDRRQRHAR